MNTTAHNSSINNIGSEPKSPLDAPLVSIVIPVYNGEKYIQTAVNSVLEQTYQNYEIIVIDDGSTDNTRQKLHPYHEQIRYVFQENSGSAAARNLGIKLAKGEFIAFLDSDDFWLMPEKLEKQVALFGDRPSLGGINTGWQIVDGEGKPIKTVQPWHKAPKLDLETWLKKKCVRTSAMIFRRQWLEKVGGFDEELRQSHDVDLILRLSLAGCETEWLREETVCYRQHESNTTKDSLKQAKYIQAVLDKFFARTDLPKSISKQERQIRYHTLVWIAWYQYHDDNLDQMVAFLRKSLSFSPYLLVENISHWLTTFERFSAERGEKFPTDVVTSSPSGISL
ncbi:MAG: glycosyltransferase [Cyanobacteria bacterium J06600_6]